MILLLLTLLVRNIEYWLNHYINNGRHPLVYIDPIMSRNVLSADYDHVEHEIPNYVDFLEVSSPYLPLTCRDGDADWRTADRIMV